MCEDSLRLHDHGGVFFFFYQDRHRLQHMGFSFHFVFLSLVISASYLAVISSHWKTYQPYVRLNQYLLPLNFLLIMPCSRGENALCPSGQGSPVKSDNTLSAFDSLVMSDDAFSPLSVVERDDPVEPDNAFTQPRNGHILGTSPVRPELSFPQSQYKPVESDNARSSDKIYEQENALDQLRHLASESDVPLEPENLHEPTTSVERHSLFGAKRKASVITLPMKGWDRAIMRFLVPRVKRYVDRTAELYESEFYMEALTLLQKVHNDLKDGTEALDSLKHLS